MSYDLLVLGDTTAAWAGATAAAKAGYNVGLIHPVQSTAWDLRNIPHDLLWDFCRPERHSLNGTRLPVVTEWEARCGELRQLIVAEQTIRRAALQTAGGELRTGAAVVRSAQQVDLRVDGESDILQLTTEALLVATGTAADLPVFGLGWPVTRSRNAAEILQATQLDREQIVVGASQTGLRAACLLARYGVKVTVVDGQNPTTAVLPPETRDWWELARTLGVQWRLGEDVIGGRATPKAVTCLLESGETLTTGQVWWATARRGRINPTWSLPVDDRQRLWCNANLQTWVEGIWAAGDVVGFSQTTRSESTAGQFAALQALLARVPVLSN